MRDIPMFTGQFGVASLIFREIPFSRCAYVLVRSALPGRMEAFLDECRGFCRAAGAARSLASAESPLPLPHAYDVLELRCRRQTLQPPEPPVALLPVMPEHAAEYRACYNELFRQVPNAAGCTAAGLEALLARGEQACLALVGAQVAGIAQWTDGVLRAVGVLPAFRGLGGPLVRTVCSRMTAAEVTLEVASTNGPALALYRRLGFGADRLCSSWYVLDASTGR